MKGQPNAPVWLKRQADGEYEHPLDYGGANSLLKRLCERAKLKRKLQMYDFRHRRATKYARILTEEQMNIHFGWTPGSRMPRRYVHMSCRDVDPAVLKAHGFNVKDEEIGKQKPPQECSRCRAKNSPLAQFCHKCGLALDVKNVMELDRKTFGGEDFASMKAEISQLKEELVRQKAFEEYVRKRMGEKGFFHPRRKETT